MQELRLGFIGTGNMGGALVRAAAKGDAAKLYLADHFPAKAQALAQEVGGTAADNQSIAAGCRYIFLGVKPNMMADMLSGIADTLRARADRFVLVSMAAGVSIADIQGMAGAAYPVIRIMPNLAASVGEGMVLYACSDHVTQDETELFMETLARAGRFDELPETLIDAASAISGCGPAFVCLFIEALADGGVRCGLPRDKAMLYAMQTLKGTAQMLLESGEHPGALKDAVCSPGGTTIEGVQALESGTFRGVVMSAVGAAYEKTKHLK